MKLRIALLALACLSAFANAQTTQPVHVNGETWTDTAGEPINAHGGGVLFHDGVYYWYGENRGRRTPDVRWPPSPGVSVYSSSDLLNWSNDGIALATVDDEQSDITRGCNIERPKVIYNAKTGKFVMWFHLELKGRGYAAARTAVAVADKPTGPFKFIRSLRPNAGHWPIEFPAELRTPLDQQQARAALAEPNFRSGLREGVYTRRDFAGGQMARDMTLYVDDDGKGYHIASAEENYTLNLHELTDDYLDFTGKWTRIQPGGHNEAPAILKHDGKYHMLASGCTGWAPNEARALVADSIWGPWVPNGNPTHGTNPQNGMGPEKTFGGQSTWILAQPGKPGAYIAMFDVWRPRNLIESGYIWLPLTMENGKMKIEYREQWKLGE